MLAVTVEVKIKPGKEAEFEQIGRDASKVIEANEPGNLFYRVYRMDDPQTYLIIERYKDQAALDAHGASAHVAEISPRFQAVAAGDPVMNIYEEIE